MSNKREKRRQTLSHRLEQISEIFETERDFHYREMLHGLQTTLSSLHAGTNDAFLERLADLEEHRDQELVRLKLWEKYQLDCADRLYEQEIEAAQREQRQMIQLVKERLMAKLEAQRKKLKEDKALLDIANDYSFFLNHTNHNSYNAGSASAGLVSATNHHHDDGGDSSDNRSKGASPGPRSARRTLRRPDAYQDFSGLSGTEASGQFNGFAARSKGVAAGTRAATSDAELMSERDVFEGILFAKERDMPSTRHTSRSYQGVAALKADEIMEDLALMRIPSKRKR